MEDDHVRRLKKEENRRTNHERDLPMGWRKKRGGEATLSGPSRGQGLKPGTPFTLARTTEIHCTSGDKYRIEGRLSERVYVVRALRSKRLYAMKLEWLSRDRSTKQMLREVCVLSDVDKHPDRFTRHLPRMQNKGRVSKAFNFMVYTWCDMNLNDVRTHYLKGADFSKVDAARICLQTFQGVHDVHTLGYLHRVVQPSKFMIGINKPHLVYTMGFSRSYHAEQRYDIKPSTSPRKLPKLANRSFLSRNYHRQKDMHRKDDLESWIFCCFNFFGRRLLPWSESFNDLNMLVNKERLFCDGFEECYKHVPKQIQAIMHNLDKYPEKARPDYPFIGMTLMTIKESIKFKLTGPFDFQKKGGQAEEQPEEGKGGADAIVLMEAGDEKAGKGGAKKAGFKDDDEEDSDEQEAKPGTPVATPPPPPPPAAAPSPVVPMQQAAPAVPPPVVDPYLNEKLQLRRELEDIQRQLTAGASNKNQAELEMLRRQRAEGMIKLQALNDGKSLAEAERLRQERADMLARLAALQATQQATAEQQRLQRERDQVAAQLAAALAAAKGNEEAARLKREKEQMEMTLAALAAANNNKEAERLREERAALMAALAAQTGAGGAGGNDEAARLKRENEELMRKLSEAKNSRDTAALDRERDAKNQMANKLAEAQKQRDAAAGPKAATPTVKHSNPTITPAKPTSIPFTAPGEKGGGVHSAYM